MYLKSEKCEFHFTEVFFLEFIIIKGSLQIDPKKTKSVRDWPRSSSVNVQHFLGFVYFY